MRVQSTDDVSLRLRDLGGRAGEPILVLAHATGFHGAVWAPLAAAITGHRCVAPDLRGHGDSPVPEGSELAWESFADDVLAVVDAVSGPSPDRVVNGPSPDRVVSGPSPDRVVSGPSPDRVVGAGHSKGGAALLLAEARRPGTFDALWCFEPVVFPPDLAALAGSGPNPMAAGARARRERFASRAEAESNFAAKPPMDAFDPRARAAYVREGFVAEDAGDRAAGDQGPVVLACRPDDEARMYEMGGRNQAFERLGMVGCPTTVVRGRLGTGPPADVAEQVAGALPHGRLEVHDELGHFGPLEAPEAMAASMLAAIG